MTDMRERLYNLLPAVYRLRDAEQEYPLRQLIQVIADQLNLVEEDIAQLYDDWFIETCAEWLVPYIGDLLGVRNLQPVAGAGFTLRARVANTLGYRRRKGTAAVLEQLARDTTLWSARAVEYFQLLETTQYINHIRLENKRTPDLRDANALELLDTPFDTIAHTGDVRHIANRRGKHNIPNIGIFLWRLQNYELAGSTPYPLSSTSVGQFFFSSLGNNTPLFNAPRSETTISHLAREVDVPAPIRPLAFHLDLRAYQQKWAAVQPDRRRGRSQYYGEGASLQVQRGNDPVPPLDVVCMDLSEWGRPPATIKLLLSADLSTFPSPLPANPKLDVTIGSTGPRTLTLSASPADLNQARLLLEQAIQGADPSPAFRGARVVVAGDRLGVIPAEAGAAVVFADSGGDTSASQLGLVSGSMVYAALSTRLHPFPNVPPGSLRVQIGAVGPFTISFGELTSLSQAAGLLQTTIRAADPSNPPAFTGASVQVLEDRLLILPAPPGGRVTISPSASDPATAYLLGLVDRVGIDVRLGRLVFPLDDPADDILVSYNYGFSGDLGGGTYDRRFVRQPGDPFPTPYQDTVAKPDGLDALIKVGEGITGGFTSLSLALAHWKNVLNRPAAVIEIADSRTYPLPLAGLQIDMTDTELVIQAANEQRPTLVGDIKVGGNQKGRLALNGLLISGSVSVPDPLALATLDILHTTLVPGISLDAEANPLSPERASLVVSPANITLQVNLERSISGPLHLPQTLAGLSVRDCLLESPLRDKPAQLIPALLSGAISPFPALPANPALQVTIGDDGPYTLVMSAKPTDLDQARLLLENGLHSVSSSQAFSQAQVVRSGNRLIVLPGSPESILIEPLPTDDSATKLALKQGLSKSTFALVSGPLKLPVTSASPQVSLTIGAVTKTINLSPAPATLADARQRLQDSIHAQAGAAFQQSIVAQLGAGRLVVLPGGSAAALRFQATSNDLTTLDEYGLESDFFLIAASDTGEQPGPPARFERTTLLGRLHVKELELASESIFASPVFAARRQEGCVRFSFVAGGSRTPQRHRCQPDLEYASELESAGALDEAGKALLLKRILSWLAPSFTSTRYGEPAYGQLSQACPSQIKTGAEDGSEMGAFCFLKQPQREANLRLSLDEYLRFGLEAGIFYIT